MRNLVRRSFGAVAVALAALTAGAFPEIPRESAKALGVTRGGKVSDGLVFVNGKFLAPPYRVERWGTGIRINKVPVTGQVIDWSEFLKTQSGFAPKAAAPEATPAAPTPPPAVAPAPANETADDLDGVSLDDLFDDAPLPPPKKKEPPKPVAAAQPAPPPLPEPPALTAPFVKNDASKALVKQVNAARAEIDRQLRAGGFICFGDGYSRIVGDARAAARLLDALPEIQMKSETASALRAAVRAAKLDYLHEPVCDELFRNRIDYRRLLEHRERLRRDLEWKKAMSDVPKPLF